MESFIGKALDHLAQNVRVLREAPAVFLAVLVIACGLAYELVGLRYQGALDAKNATVESLKSQIDGLQDKIKEFQGKIADKPVDPTSRARARDPDGVFQLEAQVGSVRAPQIDESRGFAFFGGIVGAVNFNVEKDFQYRNFLLHVRRFDAESRASIAGMANRALSGVTCEIVGRVSQP